MSRWLRVHRRTLSILTFGSSLFALVLTVLLIAVGTSTLPALALHLAAIIMIIAAISLWPAPPSSTPKPNCTVTKHDLGPMTVVVGLQLLGLIYMTTFPFHYVQDEFITGYTSYTLGPIIEINWYAGYPAPREWIAGFPVLYYALQLPFIEVLGLSLETIRISTWPYHLGTVVLVYLIGRDVSESRKIGVAAGVLYVLLAPNLYMAGYGMHNISSTFFFLATFYATTQALKHSNRTWAIVAGLFATAAYLTYTSSYVTFPIIVTLVLSVVVRERSIAPLRSLGIVLLITAVGLIPFLSHAFMNDNYFTQRGDQVNAISAFTNDDEIADPVTAIWDHALTNLRAVYTANIGGVTDYWFGRQALFDWLTLGFILAGLAFGLFWGIIRRRSIELVMVVTVATVFIFGMMLTLPAGGFHRTTLAYPFLAILIALVLQVIGRLASRASNRPNFGIGIVLVLISTFIVINLSSLHQMIEADEEISGLTDSVAITEFIESEIPPGTRITIIAFANYHLERELIVRTGDQYPVEIASFNDTFQTPPEHPVILFQPSDEQLAHIQAIAPTTTLRKSLNTTDLNRHVVYVP